MDRRSENRFMATSVNSGGRVVKEEPESNVYVSFSLGGPDIVQQPHSEPDVEHPSNFVHVVDEATAADDDDDDDEDDDADVYGEDDSTDSGAYILDVDAVLADPAKWLNMDDNTRCWLVQSEPVQHRLSVYPKDAGGRQFSDNHYTRRLVNGETSQRPWLVYSISSDAVFCYCCKLYHFSKFALAGQGCRDWKNLSSILKNHEKSPDHISAYHDWKELEMRIRTCKPAEGGCLDSRALTHETRHWRNVLERLTSLVRFLGAQQMPMRGVHDRLHVPDNGCFLKFVELMGEFDPVTKEHARRMKSDTLHDRCLGATFQGEVVQLLAGKIKEKVIDRLKKARYYSIILNCVPDASQRERTTLTVRFVTACEADRDTPAKVTAEEHFLGFLDSNAATGVGMSEAMFRELELSDIPACDIRGQSYDLSAYTRGMADHLQSQLKMLNSTAFLVPSGASLSTTELMDMANRLPAAVGYFGLLRDLYSFFSESAVRWSILVAHTNCDLKYSKENQWESKLDAVQVIRFRTADVHGALVAVAQDEGLSGPAGMRTRVAANNLAPRMLDFGFLCFLVVWYDLLFEADASNKRLRAISWNLEATLQELTSAKVTFQKYRTDKLYAQALSTAQELAEELCMDGQFPREGPPVPRRRRRAPDSAANATPTTAALTNPERNFRINFFDRMLDSVIECMEQRLAQLYEHGQIFSFLYNTASLQELNQHNLLKQCMIMQVALTARDGSGMDVSAVELCDELKSLSKRMAQHANPQEVLEYLCQRRLVGLFPNVFVAMRILLTLPLATSMARGPVGATLEHIKSFLHSAVARDASAGLATIAIEKEIAEELDVKEVIEKFAQAKARQINFHC